jgi:hypothetical protein
MPASLGVCVSLCICVLEAIGYLIGVDGVLVGVLGKHGLGPRLDERVEGDEEVVVVALRQERLQTVHPVRQAHGRATRARPGPGAAAGRRLRHVVPGGPHIPQLGH